MRKIKVTFNDGKQWVIFHIGTSLRKFKSDNDCHAYYVGAETRLKRRGLFGHIHEGKGTRKYKKTLCVNPGSMYEQGMLHGAVVELKQKKVENYILTTV